MEPDVSANNIERAPLSLSLSFLLPSFRVSSPEFIGIPRFFLSFPFPVPERAGSSEPFRETVLHKHAGTAATVMDFRCGR